MIVNFRRFVLALVLALLAVVSLPHAAQADTGDAPEVEAQQLIHILSYVAADYDGAVQGGSVVNETEYEEQLALVTDAGKIAARISPRARPQADGTAPDLTTKVGKVRALIEAKAGAAELGATVAEVRALVTSAFRLVETPANPPDAARGKALFLEHCATCHGAEGRGDTPRAATLNPRPANFHDSRISDPLTPERVASTVRFGIAGTAMAPFTFLSDADRWALGFYVTGLRHEVAPSAEAPTYTLAELALRSDAELRAELEAAGIPEEHRAAVLADLRLRAPYEDRAGKSPLSLARARLDRARVAIAHDDPVRARADIIDAYLEGIEPAEAQLRSLDGKLVTTLEERFLSLRAQLEAGASKLELNASIDAMLAEVTRAEMVLNSPASGQSYLSTVLSSGGIVLREGVEAALLIAALLGIAAQAGLTERRRYVHLGWICAVAAGFVTWGVSSRLISISGASRELIEGITAMLATIVLFYVSYSLIAKKEVARWMRFLKGHVSPRKAALSLFGVSFLAAYREAFETVLFYQALLSSNASTSAALVGAALGAAALVVLVIAYTRAGRFAPPQVFFRISSYLLYGLAVVFVGQGIAALQIAGVFPVHPLPIRSIPALGIHATLETCLAQGLLLALAFIGVMLERKATPPPSSMTPKPVSP